jgi:Heavy metal associated domain 2
MSVAAQIAHESPGRLRLRIPDCKGDVRAFERIKGSLERCANVRQLEITPITGSILVYHDADAHAIVDYGRTHGVFTLAPSGRRGGLSRAAQQTLRMIDSRLKQQTGNSWDLRELAFLLLSTGGLVQMARRRIWPEALTLFWYATGLFSAQAAPGAGRKEGDSKM